MKDHLASLTKDILDTCALTQQSWTVGCFRSPQPVRRRETAVYPFLCVWIDRDSGRLLNTTITDGNVEETVCDQTLRLMKNCLQRPKRVFVADEELAGRIEQAMQNLDIPVKLDAESPGFERVRERIIASINS